MDSQDKIALGLKAKQLLDFKPMWEYLHEQIVNSFLGSGYDDTERREGSYKQYVALMDVQSILGDLHEQAVALLEEENED